MAMECASGLMAPYMKANGQMTILMERVYSGTIAEIFILVSFLKTRLMDLESTFIMVAADTKVNGSVTSKKDKGRRFGRTDLVMLVATKTELSMGMEYIPGLIRVSIKATGKRIR